jgi:hypothetical protein
MIRLTAEQQAALGVARSLARAGVPLFLGRPDPARPTGFALPPGWQHARPDESVVDAWQPGWALCAVTGHALDLVDVDPRDGGDERSIPMPVRYAWSDTPSGGRHHWVAPLGVESLDGKVAPGIDVKSGTPSGAGRGFGFLPPTVRVSKVDGVARPYRWRETGMLDLLGREVRPDRTGDELAALIRARREARLAAPEGAPRVLARSAAAREWAAACARLAADLAGWARSGWGGAAHQGLLEASRHLVMLSPEHAEAAYLRAFDAAGLTPDGADLAKIESALDKFAALADRVVDDDELGADEGFWAGARHQGPPPFGPEGDPAGAPPGTFDLVTPDRARRRLPPPRPAYGAFGGGRALVYDAGVHWVQGESESGKSWVAQALVLEVLRAGGLALYVDHEDREANVFERLEQLGATDEEFGRLCYVSGADVAHAAVVAHLADSDRDYACLVVDGVTSALTAAGLSGRDEQELTAWCDALPRRARMALCVDHVVKSVDERRGMAIGSQAKKSVVTGTAIEVTCRARFGRGTTGEIALSVRKDKPGGVRAWLPADRAVAVRFSSDPATGAVVLAVPSAVAAADDRMREDHGAEAMAIVEQFRAFDGATPSHSGRHLQGLYRSAEEMNGGPVAKDVLWAAINLYKARGGCGGVRVPAWLLSYESNRESVPDKIAGTPRDTPGLKINLTPERPGEMLIEGVPGRSPGHLSRARSPGHSGTPPETRSNGAGPTSVHLDIWSG